jgi:hypothetical protein
VKFVCSGCNRLEDVARFRLDGDALVVTCLQCGAENRASAKGAAPVEPATAPVLETASAPLTAPLRGGAESEGLSPPAGERVFDVPDGHCPKCISRRSPEVAACPICGLVFAQAVDTFSPSDGLKAQWLELLRCWSDEPRHEALRVEALRAGQLAEVGRLYRLRLAMRPEDLVAQRGRDEVLRLAVMPHVSQTARPGEGELPRWKVVMLSMVIVACLLALFFLVRQMLTLS